jgi:hypothetical protein
MEEKKELRMIVMSAIRKYRKFVGDSNAYIIPLFEDSEQFEEMLDKIIDLSKLTTK